MPDSTIVTSMRCASIICDLSMVGFLGPKDIAVDVNVITWKRMCKSASHVGRSKRERYFDESESILHILFDEPESD